MALVTFWLAAIAVTTISKFVIEKLGENVNER